MHIIIPMSGVGKRFIDAGYTIPKPLIVVDDKPIIEHVVDLFPGETKFTFICNSLHLKETNIRQILERIKPLANIVEIPNHKKGPVYAVHLVEGLIDDDEEVIVNYCDFGTYWDYADFLAHTRKRKADGAIPSYKGFHPHMLGKTNYAFIKESNQWLIEIKEKEPFTNNRMNEFASNGTYYFRKGEFVKKYFNELMRSELSVNGEFYVSLIFNLLVRDGLKVSIYEIQHMLQWGTPEDVHEYNTWSNYFREIINKKTTPVASARSVTLIPLAGKGSRFVAEGYTTPKPLLDVSGKPMIIQAADSLPKSGMNIFVTLKNHLENFPLKDTIINNIVNSRIVEISSVTEGQAITCALGLQDVNQDSELFIGATDNSMIYNEKHFNLLKDSKDVDAIIFTFRNHTSSKSNPHMYGWVKIDDNNNAISVSVKKPISEKPEKDHAIVGAFYFKQVSLYNKAFKSLIDNRITINGEYYIDSLMGELIKLGYSVKVFEVEHYICWGTPNDYKTFLYWQSYFHKSLTHPYSLEKDITVNYSQIDRLDKLYRSFNQLYS